MSRIIENLDDLDFKTDLEKPVSKISIISENEESFKCLVKWCVAKSDFEKNLLNAGGYFESDWFYFGERPYCRFYFKLYANEKDKYSNNYISLKIIFGSLPSNVFIDGTVSIKDREISIAFKADETDFSNFDETRKLWRYVQMRNDLEILCSIKMIVKAVKCMHDDKQIEYDKLIPKYNPYGKVLFNDKKFFDVIFRLEGQEIKAHKALLCGIEFFANLFLEDQQQIIDLENMKYDIFELVLQFIYTGDIPLLDFKLASELYVISNSLKVFVLKNICSSYLGANLTSRNVVIVLMLSNECQDFDLKKTCFEFIQGQKAQTLTEDAIII